MAYLVTLYILLDIAHRLSPLMVSWGHRGFRQLMLRQPRAYIVTPLTVFLIGALISAVSASGRGFTWATMMKVYAFWNFWHFSMQNYGVLRLCGLRHELIGRALAFGGTALGIMTIPVAISVHHWITDIGLSARVMGRWRLLFITVLLGLSPVAFLWDRAPWLWPQFIVPVYQPMTPLVIFLVGLAHSVGFAHFSVSARLWKLSNPRVRAAIGRDLFAAT